MTISRKPKGNKLKQCLRKVEVILRDHNKLHSRTRKIIANGTQYKRMKQIQLNFETLFELGYKMEDPRSIRGKHVEALMKYWLEQNLSAGTMQNKISILRTFMSWIDKANLVDYYRNKLIPVEVIKRSYNAQTDKDWSYDTEDFIKTITAIDDDDPYVAIQLLLMYAFGMRKSEAALFQPRLWDKENYIDIVRGTKNGKHRFNIPFDTPVLKQIMDHAKSLANSTTGSTIPKEYSMGSWSNHFYYICSKHGVSLRNGKVPHGLRHGFAHRKYLELSDTLPPVMQHLPKDEVKARIQHTENAVSVMMGHHRPSISGAYNGARRAT